MSLTDFVFNTILLSTSGALSPGPLFFGALLQGYRIGARGGFMIAVGHMAVEIFLVVLLSTGVAALAGKTTVKAVVSGLGGVALLIFGALQTYRSAKEMKEKARQGPLLSSNRGLVAFGAMMTGFNPFFLVWWLTVGVKLLTDAVSFSPTLGIGIMYSAHIWMDFAYLSGVAHLARKGVRFLDSRSFRLFNAALGLVFIYYGASFLISLL